jgi:ureidoglycolate hydrolase
VTSRPQRAWLRKSGPAQAATVSFGRYQALSFPAQAAEVTVISRHPFSDRQRFDPVTDLEPFCSGWATFMEDRSERLYGHPRPSLG